MYTCIWYVPRKSRDSAHFVKQSRVHNNITLSALHVHTTNIPRMYCTINTYINKRRGKNGKHMVKNRRKNRLKRVTQNDVCGAWVTSIRRREKDNGHRCAASQSLFYWRHCCSKRQRPSVFSVLMCGTRTKTPIYWGVQERVIINVKQRVTR